MTNKKELTSFDKKNLAYKKIHKIFRRRVIERGVVESKKSEKYFGVELLMD
jgi:hypothetical protein